MRPIMWERDTFSRDSAILTAIVAMLRRRNLLWQRNSTNLAAEIRLMCAKCVRNMWIVNFMAVHCLICSGWVHGPLGVLKLSDSAKTNWRRSTDIMDVFLYAWKWVSHTGWFNFFLPSLEIRMKTSYIKMAAIYTVFWFLPWCSCKTTEGEREDLLSRDMNILDHVYRLCRADRSTTLHVFSTTRVNILWVSFVL